MVVPVQILDADDPRVSVFRDVRERDVVGRGGFIAEGEVVLRALSRSRLHRAQAVLIDEKRAMSLASVIAALGDDVEVYHASRTVLDALTGFPIHRGILAHGLRAPIPTWSDLLMVCPEEAIVLALFGIANHDNIGGIFRNAAAFGAHAVLLDGACCDPLYRKAIRVSVGAALNVPFARLSANEDPLGLLGDHGFTAFAFSPRGSMTLTSVARPGRAAVLLGPEGPGLPDDILRRAQAVAIPMADSFDSLNVAVTSGIALYAMTQPSQGVADRPSEP